MVHLRERDRTTEGVTEGGGADIADPLTVAQQRLVAEQLGVERPDDRIRLIGVRMEQLSPVAEAVLGLWDTDEGWREAEGAVDAVADRFGRGSLKPAALVNPPSNPT